MNHLKVTLAVLALVVISLLVLFGGSAPILAESPNPAVPTVALPTPIVKPTSGAVSPAKVPTRALVAPTATPAPVSRSARSALFYFSYSAGFQVQNLSASNANITINYYKQDGTQPAGGMVGDSITGNLSKTYFPIGPAAPFNGSVVISSDQQVAAIVNVLGAGGLGASAAYDGSGAGSTAVSLPLLMQNNFNINTWFNVQNASNTAANVNVSYSDGTTNSFNGLPGGASHTFNQALGSETHSKTVFSGSVTSAQPLVVTVIEEDSATMFAYSGFPTAGVSPNPKPVMPLVVQNWFGTVTGMQIQNTTGAATNVTVSYTPSSAGSACTETQSIPANSSATFGLFFWSTPPAGAASTCTKGAAFVGSAQVTTNSGSASLQAIVNQTKLHVNGEAYSAFNPASATNKVSFPLIMDRNFGWFTGFNVMNVNTSGNTTVTCHFSSSAVTVSGTLAPGQALTDVQQNKLGNLYVGSATCTASNATDHIVGVVNELKQTPGDNFLVYEGINY